LLAYLDSFNVADRWQKEQLLQSYRTFGVHLIMLSRRQPEISTNGDHLYAYLLNFVPGAV